MAEWNSLVKVATITEEDVEEEEIGEDGTVSCPSRCTDSQLSCDVQYSEISEGYGCL